MNPPTVRTLDQLVAETNSVYDPQRQNYQNQIGSANARLGEQQQGLDAAKTNAFSDITQTAARRGALFSGFTPDQQARYTSEKYLPALANLRAANEQTIQGLNTNILGLDAEQRKGAIATREGDLSRLYDYNQVQEERKFQTQQAEIAYQRELNKLREQQAFEARQNSANRAASAQSNDNSTADRAAVAGSLAKVTGKDGYVSPQSYQKAKAAWTSIGYSGAQFDSYYSGFRNPTNKNYKLG